MDFQSTALGIEFGTTRIKAVLIDRNHQVLAVGSHTWENELTDGVWTYSEKAILDGLQACYADLKRNTETRYGQKLTTVGAIGISAMMHGYLPLDGNGRPLAAFRTWRNTMTAQASEILTEIFHFHIHRASVSGDPQQRGTCERHRVSHDSCRIYPLAAVR